MTTDNSKTGIKRRAFLAASPLLALGAAVAVASEDERQAVEQKPVLSRELSAAETEIVSRSKMARDLPNFFGKGHNCAESGLAVALRFLDKPPELEWIATSFGGGLQHGDLCGFLTSGVMAFGLHAGTSKLDAAVAKAACNRRVNEYWQWWTSVAPLRCDEITGGRRDKTVCPRLGQLATAKVEELLTRSA